jgi:glycosyltransferase involved in cell wall biosynthesis
LFYLELNLRLLLLLLLSKFDMVYAVDLDTLLPARVAAFLRKKRCVYDAHEYFTEVPEVVGRPLTKFVWEQVGRMAVPGLRHGITVCQSLADVFFERYGVRFKVIRNVPLRQTPKTPVEKPGPPFVLLYQGVLNEGRGLEECIEAVAMLDEEVQLWLAGEGDLSEPLREKVRGMGLSERVMFIGKLPPEKLSELTPRAHLGLNLLKNKGLSYYYSLANKAFDYVQAGVPSLGMAFPEYQRLNDQHDIFHLLPTLDPTAIADAVQFLRSNSERYEELAANCRRAAEVLNWQEEEKRLWAFFAEIERTVKAP